MDDRARPIIFGPGDKLAQLEAVAMHPETTDVDSRISIAIVSRIDKHTGLAVVGQARLAAMVHCGERTVRDAVARMQRVGLWQVTAGGGRGLANTYKPAAKRGGQPPGFRIIPGNQPPGFGPETRQMTTLNPADDDTKPGGQPPPLPNTYLNSSYGTAATGRTTVTSPSEAKGNSRNAAVATFSVTSPEMKAWIEYYTAIGNVRRASLLRQQVENSRSGKWQEATRWPPDIAKRAAE